MGGVLAPMCFLLTKLKLAIAIIGAMINEILVAISTSLLNPTPAAFGSIDFRKTK